MRQMEILHIRLLKTSDGDQVLSLCEQLQDNLNKMLDQKLVIVLLKNKNVENDWSIHLESYCDSALKEASDIASLVVETFRPIGTVNRNVWEPVLLLDHFS